MNNVVDVKTKELKMSDNSFLHRVQARVFPVGVKAIHASIGWCEVVALDADNAHQRVVRYETACQHPDVDNPTMAFADTVVHVSALTALRPALDFDFEAAKLNRSIHSFTRS
jgi:hypothetical protein